VARTFRWDGNGGGSVVSGVVTRRAVFADLLRLREIRLEAITRHPTAFSRDPESEAKLTDNEWRARIEKGWWFVCEVDGAWAGICGLSREQTPKTSHIGSFGAMYVRDSYRGKGVSDALIEAAMVEAAKVVELVVLTVNAENPRAIALYERHGFRKYGRMPRSLKIDGRYYDEIEMVRALKHP
jgi:RimJ/RimL family protein N-acetyltransferase